MRKCKRELTVIGLTDHKNVIDVNDVNPVYIPLASGNSTSFDIKVEVEIK